MSLPDELTRDEILAAITDYLRGDVSHDFIESTKFDLLHDGQRFPPKAITGLAALRHTGELPAPRDFTGGVGSKCFRLLQGAGFRVVPKLGMIPFDVGHTYTRKKIGEYLGTDEDTTKGDWATGYHLHRDDAAGIPGWWFLFPSVGEEARTGHDYHNAWLSETELQWEGKTHAHQGQPQIDSLLSGNAPVLLFSRDSNRDPFTFHGLATPSRIEDTTPVRLVWVVDAQSTVPPALTDAESLPDESDYVPTAGDQRQRVLREIRQRRGQQQFRATLLDAFGSRCVVSGCDVVGVLEAAHIRPYRGEQDNHPNNGLLLRTDLHTLFDLNLLGIEPVSQVIHIHPAARRTPYDQFHGQRLTTPVPLSDVALLSRWQEFLAADHH